MTTHEVLVAARNLLDRGWMQGSEGIRPGGSVCALGAIGRVLNVRLTDYAAGPGYSYAEMYGTDSCRVLAEAMGVEPGPQVFNWNDHPGRTKAEVLAAFDRAIAATAPPPPDPHWTDLVVDVERLETSRAVIA